MSEFSIYDIGCIFFQLWRNKWIVLLVTLAGLMAGLALTADNEPEARYRAASSVCVTYTTYQEQMRGSSVLTSYSDLVSSHLVCERAAAILSDTGLTASDIQEMISSWISSNSYVMSINATAAEAQLAVRVANAAAQAFVEKVSSVSGNNSLQILDTAQTASTLANTLNNKIVLATLGPFLLVCAWIALREVARGKLRFISQCAEEQEELLGILPDTKLWE